MAPLCRLSLNAALARVAARAVASNIVLASGRGAASQPRMSGRCSASSTAPPNTAAPDMNSAGVTPCQIFRWK